MTTAAVDVVRRYLSGHEIEVLASDARMTDHALGITYEGPDPIGSVIRTMYEETFPGATARMRHLTGGADIATLEFTFCGNQQGPLGDLAPTGRDLEVAMCAVYRVAGERITTIDLYYDRTTMLEQLSG